MVNEIASDFWPQFWPNLIATVLGVFVGFWLALRADHARERNASQARELALLRAARDAVQANLTLITQIRPILAAVPPLPSFEMDVVLLDVLLPQLAELSPDTDLLADLNNFRFQLHHVNRKLDHLLRIGLFPPLGGTLPPLQGAPTGPSAINTALALMAQGILLTLKPLVPQAVMPRLDARIVVLEKPRWPWWWFWGG
jgi:hypothetical protein